MTSLTWSDLQKYAVKEKTDSSGSSSGGGGGCEDTLSSHTYTHCTCRQQYVQDKKLSYRWQTARRV